MRRRCVFRNLAVAALAAALSSAAQAQQLPANGRLVAGSGSIAQTGNTLTVTQTSPRLIADWQSFNIGSQSSVVFNQPNAAAVALNRVTGTTPSMIDGALRANGQVFLLNPNGVLFGNGARVDVGALVASSLQMSNADFLAGNYRLNAGPFAGTVSNAGRINASGGVVALIAPSVSNTGQITADKGSVALAAGNAVNLDFVGDGLVNIKVEQGAIDALVENKGLIQADGGRVVMTTQAAQDLVNNVVNNEGVVQARTLENHGGRILLSAGTSLGEAKAGGTLDVSASAGQGGKIQVFGDKVSVETGARLDATGAQGGGEILIGGGWQGSGG
ncbi:MAG: filamentous hemagglutinin N-terminal domain-containing protein, partial [Proteobacteria bacterium]|nr:filamentous hemagglutinin N-terminal domain-containing protein [Pseudomonadota bacterium]